MSATTEKIKNYFDAIERFYSTWLNMLESAIPNSQDGKQIKKEAENFRSEMNNSLDELEKMALDQQNKIETMTPEQYQQDTLNSLKDFEQAYDESTAYVKQKLKEQEEYIQSDQFLTDAADASSQAQQVMNTMLDGFSNLVNNFTDNMKNA